MVTLKSHGTRDGDVAVDLDHRDVVRGKWTQARTWRDLDPQTHYRHSPGLFLTRLRSGVAYAVLLPISFFIHR